jgi:hypothetical protein
MLQPAGFPLGVESPLRVLAFLYVLWVEILRAENKVKVFNTEDAETCECTE